MGAESLAELVEEVRKAAVSMADGDTKTNQRIDTIEKSVNEIYKRVQRPGPEGGPANDNDLIRKEAADFCVLRHNVTVPKSDGNVIYLPSPAEIDNAITARTALASLWRLGDPNRLDQLQRKSLQLFQARRL
jgi:hypothetical protein